MGEKKRARSRQVANPTCANLYQVRSHCAFAFLLYKRFSFLVWNSVKKQCLNVIIPWTRDCYIKNLIQNKSGVSFSCVITLPGHILLSAALWYAWSYPAALFTLVRTHNITISVKYSVGHCRSLTRVLLKQKFFSKSSVWAKTGNLEHFSTHDFYARRRTTVYPRHTTVYPRPKLKLLSCIFVLVWPGHESLMQTVASQLPLWFDQGLNHTILASSSG
jgi:hypothetical protein